MALCSFCKKRGKLNQIRIYRGMKEYLCKTCNSCLTNFPEIRAWGPGLLKYLPNFGPDSYQELSINNIKSLLNDMLSYEVLK